MKITAAILLLFFGVILVAQNSTKPQIHAFFDRIDDGPAFFVECRNTSGGHISSGAKIWIRSLRLDGRTVPESGNEFGPGLTTDVGPGLLWRGIIALRQSYVSSFPAVKFGALRRRAEVLPLTQGQHTIAVECAGVWSDEVGFYWDGETMPKY
ncbi:MAG: hypothetical protein M3O09_04275 [Acidobacteriota bacterium]|nr:hypothetical protein [Acidobacteriota bacterium]